MKKRIMTVLFVAVLVVSIFAIGVFSADAVENTHTITFDVQGIGETPAPITVNDGDCYLYLREHGQNNPTADGYVFHCWVTTLDFEQDEVMMSNTAAYLETPIKEDITLYAVWYKLIDAVEIKVDPPVAGDVIGTDVYATEDFSFTYQSPRPHAEAIGEGYRVKDSFWSAIGPAVFWLEDADDRESLFEGTFEDGKEYGVSVEVEPEFGYEFTDHLKVTFNGAVLDEAKACDYNLCMITAPIRCGEKPAETEPNTGVVPTGDHSSYFFSCTGLILSALMIVILRNKNAIPQTNK